MGLVAAVVLLMTSCSGSRALIGQWKKYTSRTYGQESGEFFKDGSCFFETGGTRLSCRWASLEDGRFKVEISSFAGVLTLIGTVSGDELVLDDGREKTTWARVNSQRAQQVEEAARAEQRRIEEEKRRALAQEEARRQVQLREAEARREAERLAQERAQRVQRLLRDAREFERNGMMDLAMESFRQVAELGSAEAQNAVAWRYATASNPKHQDGQAAIRYATQATAQVPDNWSFQDTLAAAYARNGQYDQAVRTQVRAIGLLRERGSPDKYLKEAEQRLELYRAKKPYSER